MEHTTKELINNAIVIAKFMGWQDKPHQTMSPDKSTNFSNEYMRFESPDGNTSLSYYHDDFLSIPQLDFTSCWGALMPVVEKIESIMSDGVNWDYCVTIERDFCVISHKGESPIVEVQGEEESKIQVVYDAIIQFIAFYNAA